MSFGSNVMPKRFGAGRKKPKTQAAQQTIWEAGRKPETQAEQLKKIEDIWNGSIDSQQPIPLSWWEAGRKPKKGT